MARECSSRWGKRIAGCESSPRSTINVDLAFAREMSRSVSRAISRSRAAELLEKDAEGEQIKTQAQRRVIKIVRDSNGENFRDEEE